MKNYIIEIREPTNNPGDWVTKIVLQDKQQAEEMVEKLIADEDYEELTDVEWDDKGPNWKRLRTVCVDDETIITLDIVDNALAQGGNE